MLVHLSHFSRTITQKEKIITTSNRRLNHFILAKFLLDESTSKEYYMYYMREREKEKEKEKEEAIYIYVYRQFHVNSDKK